MKKILIAILIVIIGCLLYFLRVFPPIPFSNEYFGIEPFISSIDKDQDGIEDQQDILNNVYEYIKTKPKYKSKYYDGGYSNDEYGVCTDLVAIGLKNAGYDLMELVHADVLTHPENYDIEVVDKNIDFRRVRNLLVYFEHHAISLSTDLNDISEWQGGDIVVFEEHIGILSNKRNYKGIPLLIHHGNPFQIHYEEDVLERYEILGHYRISE